jgi:beta-phosphoglucomutase
MALKAVLFDFNGVIINDEPLHQRLIEQMLLEENICLQAGEFAQFCLGKSDRLCFKGLFENRGRVLTDRHLQRLIDRKAAFYQTGLAELEPLPIFPGLEDLIYRFRIANVALAIVSGALRQEITQVLERTGLASYFSVIVAGDDLEASKPDPSSYLLGIERLQQAFPDLELTAADCLAIEDSFPGLEAAKRAGISVVGVAHTYPFHMMHRHANWAIDHLNDLELERVEAILGHNANPGDGPADRPVPPQETVPQI